MNQAVPGGLRARPSALAAGQTVNRRPKRAHPHCPLNTLTCKLFLALRWAPFGRRSALNRSPPSLVEWQTFQVLRHRRWVGPLWTLIHRVNAKTLRHVWTPALAQEEFSGL